MIFLRTSSKPVARTATRNAIVEDLVERPSQDRDCAATTAHFTLTIVTHAKDQQLNDATIRPLRFDHSDTSTRTIDTGIVRAIVYERSRAW